MRLLRILKVFEYYNIQKFECRFKNNQNIYMNKFIFFTNIWNTFFLIENIKLDIRFLENRKLSCTVEKDDFAKSIKMNIEDFNYDALVDLLRERNISVSELAKKAKLL